MKSEMSNPFVTPAQRAYILAHLNDRPRTAVARAAGVSTATLYRIVRQAGGKLLHERATRRPEAEAIVRHLYPTMTAAEIAARHGMAKGTINKIARELGITHSPETLARIEEVALANLGNVPPEARARAHRKWRITRRIDELRFLSGQPQQTGHRFAATPQRIYKAKWCLCHKYAYRQDPADPYALLYTPATRRIREQHYERRYGLRFRPAPGP